MRFPLIQPWERIVFAVRNQTGVALPEILPLHLQ
jgi:hypothetical protein